MIKGSTSQLAAGKSWMGRLVAGIRCSKHPQLSFLREGGTFWKRRSTFQTRWEARTVLKELVVASLLILSSFSTYCRS